MPFHCATHAPPVENAPQVVYQFLLIAFAAWSLAPNGGDVFEQKETAMRGVEAGTD
jgi:hypothetical protein